MMYPTIIEGGIHVDERGAIGYVNDLLLDDVKRFYYVIPKPGVARGWHGHKEEKKYITVVHGTAIVGAVLIDDWNNPSKEAMFWRYEMNGNKPSVLCVPAGYANGFLALSATTIVLAFSTATLEESEQDTFRYDPYYWNIWGQK